jgi:hypothetical protein
MKRLFIILIGTLGVLYLLYKLDYPTFSWHQKLTVSIETPDGLKTGSAVTQVRVWFQPTYFLGGRGGGNDVQGEATIVEVAPGKYLFVLIGKETDIAYNLYKAGQKGKRPTWAEVYEVLRKEKGVPKSSMPFVYQRFVTFTDINDPTTVTEVDPANLAATFGTGYALNDVTIEATDEKVTDGFVTTFGFFSQLEKQVTLSGLQRYDASKPDEVNYLTNSAFRIGFGK